LVVCGAMTHMCIDSGVRAAHDLGFKCVVAGDACATRDAQFQGTTVKARFARLPHTHTHAANTS
jgi:nicotinamidase-related amidase